MQLGEKTKGHKLTFPPKMGPLHLDLLFVRPKTLQLPKVFCQGPSRFHRREKMVLVACFQNYFVGKAKLVYSPPLLKPNGGPPPSFFLKKQTIAKNSDCQFSPSRLPLLPNPSTASRAHSLRLRLRRGGSTVLYSGTVGRSVVSRFCLLAKVERPTEEAAAVWPKCLTSCCMVVRQKRKKNRR